MKSTVKVRFLCADQRGTLQESSRYVCFANPLRSERSAAVQTWETRLSLRPSAEGTAMDTRSNQTGGPKRWRRVSSIVVDTLYSEIRESPRAVVPKGETTPLPRVSIAGRDGDARRKPPNRRFKTAEESLLHRFGRLGCRDRRSHPCCVAKRREGRALFTHLPPGIARLFGELSPTPAPSDSLA